MSQATRQKALFQCPDCLHEAEIVTPPLTAPGQKFDPKAPENVYPMPAPAWWPRCFECGAVLWIVTQLATDLLT